MSLTILGIESSCDDTAASVVVDGQVRSNIIADQAVHAQYGGVVPEMASRAHQAHIVPVVSAALQKAGVTLEDLDGIAFTRGPGLLGSLIVGVSFAKGLALSLDIPLIDVHHLEAHVMAHYAEEEVPVEPFLCLIVSGGHTQIMRVDSPLEMTLLGATRDDAAGEAFDKSGKLLGLSYPAGPQIDRLAKEGSPQFHFPRPRMAGYDYSFSGLKTAIRVFLEKETRQDPTFADRHLADICASIQEAIVDISLEPLFAAASDLGISTLAIAGGVSANSRLRQVFQERGKEAGYTCLIPPISYSTDNAAMIAVAGTYRYQAGRRAKLDCRPEARIPLISGR